MLLLVDSEDPIPVQVQGVLDVAVVALLPPLAGKSCLDVDAVCPLLGEQRSRTLQNLEFKAFDIDLQDRDASFGEGLGQQIEGAALDVEETRIVRGRNRIAIDLRNDPCHRFCSVHPNSPCASPHRHVVVVDRIAGELRRMGFGAVQCARVGLDQMGFADLQAGLQEALESRPVERPHIDVSDAALVEKGRDVLEERVNALRGGFHWCSSVSVVTARRSARRTDRAEVKGGSVEFRVGYRA